MIAENEQIENIQDQVQIPIPLAPLDYNRYMYANVYAFLPFFTQLWYFMFLLLSSSIILTVF